MKEIQMVDLKSQYQHIKAEIDAEIQAVIDSTAFIKGGKVAEFQQNLERYLGVKHVIPVGNGTDALQISLMALGLKPGDEVITPTFTFVATAEVVALLGLTPVFADVEPDTFCLSLESVERAITPKTKAIVPVHLFGQNADMEGLLALAKKHNLFVIEDACQSIGAKYFFTDGSVGMSGCMGQMGCTSFFPSKNLGCYGDGGAIFTNNDQLAEEARCIANHGMKVRYHSERIGVNSRLDCIQAAVLDVKLRHFDSFLQKRQQAAEFYDKAFANPPFCSIPTRTSFSQHTFHQYTLTLADDVNRNLLRQKLAEKGIPTMVYFPECLHLQPAYLKFRKGDFPVAEKLSETVLSLPMHTELSTEQQDFITNNILELLPTCIRK